MTIEINPIGVIRTPYKKVSDMPIQPMAATSCEAYIELDRKYLAGLKDIEGFSHLTLLYHFHKVEGYELQVTPFMDDEEHGIFACRSPKRPNAIGISTVQLLSVEDNIIHIAQADVLDGTPVVDIKPFFARYDNRTEHVRSGWLDKNKPLPAEKMVSDNRFE